MVTRLWCGRQSSRCTVVIRSTSGHCTIVGVIWTGGNGISINRKICRVYCRSSRDPYRKVCAGTGGCINVVGPIDKMIARKGTRVKDMRLAGRCSNRGRRIRRSGPITVSYPHSTIRSIIGFSRQYRFCSLHIGCPCTADEECEKKEDSMYAAYHVRVVIKNRAQRYYIFYGKHSQFVQKHSQIVQKCINSPYFPKIHTISWGWRDGHIAHRGIGGIAGDGIWSAFVYKGELGVPSFSNVSSCLAARNM